MSGKRDKVKDKDRYSIITQDLEHCYICGRPNVELHEIFFGSKRAISKEEGLVVPLCKTHHTGSNQAVHYNKDVDNSLKKIGERFWILENKSTDDTAETIKQKFINKFRVNFLDDEEIEEVLNID